MLILRGIRAIVGKIGVHNGVRMGTSRSFRRRIGFFFLGILHTGLSFHLGSRFCTSARPS